MGDITITMALGLLDPADDTQWTHEGLPRMDVIERMVDDHSITRKDVTDADPEFCREVAAQRKSDAETEADDAVAQEEAQDEPSDEVQAGVQEETQGQVNAEEKLKAEILTVSQEIEVLAAEETEVGKHKDELIRHLRLLQQKTNKQHSASADMKARMAFIRSQGEQRAKRYEKGRKIMAIIGKDGINPQSKIDQAMRRKTARGTRRPPPRTPHQ